MLKKLKRRYPSAEIKSSPSNLSNMIWFFIDEDQKYFGIPLNEITSSEIELLKTLFPTFHTDMALSTSNQSKKWFDYLFNDHPALPDDDVKKSFRIIQFFISQYEDTLDAKSWEEAIKALFPHEVNIVFSSAKEGIIIEEKKDYILSLSELQTSIKTLESDFLFTIHFYLGQFYSIIDLKSIFQLEQSFFHFASTEMAKDRIFSLTNVLPLYLLKNTPNKLRESFFASMFEIFKEDKELRRTIKLYIENNSNASLTAKQLFLHRNSLQYRIDKFVEKTGLDLKTFPNVLIVYLACIDFEYFH